MVYVLDGIRAKDLEDDRVVRGMEDINAGDPESTVLTHNSYEIHVFLLVKFLVPFIFVDGYWFLQFSDSKFTRSFNYLFSGNSLGRTITQNPVSKVLLYVSTICLFFLSFCKLSFDFSLVVFFQSSNQNIHGSIEEDEKVQQVWVNAEVFDYKTERLFRYLQVQKHNQSTLFLFSLMGTPNSSKFYFST